MFELVLMKAHPHKPLNSFSMCCLTCWIFPTLSYFTSDFHHCFDIQLFPVAVILNLTALWWHFKKNSLSVSTATNVLLILVEGKQNVSYLGPLYLKSHISDTICYCISLLCPVHYHPVWTLVSKIKVIKLVSVLLKFSSISFLISESTNKGSVLFPPSCRHDIMEL